MRHTREKAGQHESMVFRSSDVEEAGVGLTDALRSFGLTRPLKLARGQHGFENGSLYSYRPGWVIARKNELGPGWRDVAYTWPPIKSNRDAALSFQYAAHVLDYLATELHLEAAPDDR
jgi:hypothetical protein